MSRSFPTFPIEPGFLPFFAPFDPGFSKGPFSGSGTRFDREIDRGWVEVWCDLFDGTIDGDVCTCDTMASSPPRVVEGGSIPFACEGEEGEEDEDWIFGTRVDETETRATSATVGERGRVSEPVPWQAVHAQQESEETWEEGQYQTYETSGPVVEENDALPDGWVAGVDPQTGYTYYWNANTGVSTWERPGTMESNAEVHATMSTTHEETWQMERNSAEPIQEPKLFVPGTHANLTHRKAEHTQGERCPHGRSLHACVAFGFGGRVYTIRSESQPGSVQVTAVGSLLRKHRPEDVKTMEGFPSPACWEKGDRLAKYAAARAANCENSCTDEEGEAQVLLWKLLHILCAHKGELRSKGGKPKKDLPEKALAEILCPHLGDASWAGGMSGYSVMNPLSGESAENAHAASSRIQDHLIVGELDRAIQLARDSGLWSVALLLAQHAGEKMFKEVAAEYAKRSMKQGSPLQVLSLLFAGSGGEIRNLTSSSETHSHPPGFVGKPSTHVPHGGRKGNICSALSTPLLSDWRKSVAIIASNRAERGEEALVAIGDALWSTSGQYSAAQLSYIVGGMPLQPKSQDARLCLVGADHRRYPRTFATNEAIQRTEVFEAAILMGFPQTLIACFQPYKIMYAYRLVEAGFPEKALRYCHAIDKILKKGKGHPHLVETIHEQLAVLTERLTTHLVGFNPRAVQESGPGGVLGGLGRLLDKGVNMLIGGDEVDTQNGSGTSHARQLSSGASYTQAQSDPPQEGHHRRTSSVFSDVSIAESEMPGDQAQRKVLDGSFMRSLSSKALGLFGSSRSKPEEMIGEENKFYFDEHLGIWREQGKDVPQEEEPPPPPPTSFSTPTPVQGQNWIPQSDEAKSQLLPQGSGNLGSHVPRGNVRSRYVDAYAAVKSSGYPATQAILPGQQQGSASSPNVFIPGVPRSQSLVHKGAEGQLCTGGFSADAPGTSQTAQMGLARSASAGHTSYGPQFASASQGIAASTMKSEAPPAQNRPTVHWQSHAATAAHPGYHPYVGAPNSTGHGNDTNQFKDVHL